MQFCNFRIALFVFFFSRIHHRSLITLFLFVVLTCLPPSFGALVPVMARFLHCSSSSFPSLLQMLFLLSFSPQVALQAEIWLFVVQLSEVVVDPLGGSGAVWGCLPGGNAASHSGRSSAVAGRMPELWLQSYSNSYVPVLYFPSLFVGFFSSSAASTHLSES